MHAGIVWGACATSTRSCDACDDKHTKAWHVAFGAASRGARDGQHSPVIDAVARIAMPYGACHAHTYCQPNAGQQQHTQSHAGAASRLLWNHSNILPVGIEPTTYGS